MNYDTIALEIEKLLLTNFIDANIYVVHSEIDDEYFIYTKNKELYYSDKYQRSIMEIKMNTLWKQNITNFYFALDLRHNQFVNIDDKSIFTSVETDSYTNWNIYYIGEPNYNYTTDYYPLAA